jgi:hypothetical protein
MSISACHDYPGATADVSGRVQVLACCAPLRWGHGGMSHVYNRRVNRPRGGLKADFQHAGAKINGQKRSKPRPASKILLVPRPSKLIWQRLTKADPRQWLLSSRSTTDRAPNRSRNVNSRAPIPASIRAASPRSAGNAACFRTLRCGEGVDGMRLEMTVYPLDFQRRAEQKWARRFHSVRLPVARGGNCVRAPIPAGASAPSRAAGLAQLPRRTSRVIRAH